jgi:putative aminopeptidase FrvX
MATPELLHALITAAGPSGHETAPAKVWRDGCATFSDDVRGDVVGSSMARVPGTAGGPTLAVIGHIDEIGVHVTHIDDDGYLRFGEVGGWDPIVLVGQRVVITTRGGTVPGVIGRKPIHLIKSDERDRAPKIKDLHIDIGAKDGDEAREMVRIGDVGVIAAEPVELPNGRLVSRSLDNRIGCYVAAEAARLVALDGGAPGDVVALAVTQEETTFAGSRTSAFALEPDVAIVVDVTFATDQPGIELGPMTKHPLGSGPVIARGTTLHPRVSELLYDAAEAEELPHTLESMGRATGTDADAVHAARAGIPTGVVSVPLRYMHSPVELVSLADIQVAAELIAAFAKRLEPGISFER